MPLVQRLVPRSTVSSAPAAGASSPQPVLSIEQGIKAKVKDPLWFLARQWQMAEFEASNGGAVRKAKVQYASQSVRKVSASGAPGSIANPRLPWEAVVGSGNKPQDAVPGKDALAKAKPGWDSMRLCYDFSLKAGTCLATSKLKAAGYRGDHLDWHQFILTTSWFAGRKKETEAFPQTVRFRGLPASRWWEFEDEETNLADLTPSGQNILTLLLLEFGLVYSNDWFVIPLRQEVGSIRRVTKLHVVDSFGKETEIKPNKSSLSARNGFRMFQLERDKWLGWTKQTSSEFLLFPNALAKHARSSAVEEVVLRRDDVSNLVWAIEKKRFSLESSDAQASGWPVIKVENLEGANGVRQDLVLDISLNGSATASRVVIGGAMTVGSEARADIRVLGLPPRWAVALMEPDALSVRVLASGETRRLKVNETVQAGSVKLGLRTTRLSPGQEAAAVPAAETNTGEKRFEYIAALPMPGNWVPYVAIPYRSVWYVRLVRRLALFFKKFAQRWRAAYPPADGPAAPTPASTVANQVFDSVEQAYETIGAAFLQRGRTQSDVDVSFELIKQYRTSILASSRKLEMGCVASVPISVTETIEAVPYGAEKWGYRESALAKDRYEAYRVDPGRGRFVWISRARRPCVSSESLQVEFDVIRARE
jgi:hypothetical protein